MYEKSEIYKKMSKKEYELEEKKRELKEAKDEYRTVLIEESIQNVLRVLKEEGSLTERDLKIFLGDLSVKTKQLYSK